MIPSQLLSPAKQRLKAKYERVYSAYLALRSKGVASQTAKKIVADQNEITVSGVELIMKSFKNQTNGQH